MHCPEHPDFICSEVNPLEPGEPRRLSQSANTVITDMISGNKKLPHFRQMWRLRDRSKPSVTDLIVKTQTQVRQVKQKRRIRQSLCSNFCNPVQSKLKSI